MARNRPQQQATQALTMPAPMGGINNAAPLSQMPITDTIMTENMRATAYGLSVRKGYKQWCETIPEGNGVKTIIPGNSSGRLNVGDKLFATTNDGIYDVTVFGGPPVKVVDFPDKDDDAGWCSWHNFTNIGGLQYILICDLINGYYFYDFQLDTFSKVEGGTGPGKINGVDPDEFCYVTVWKNRVWFVQRNSTRGWYLETVGIFTGKAIAFDFGSKFRYGGFLKTLNNWTLDAGVGVDDHLVAVSSEGDVLVYTGTDPTTAGSFGLKGNWFIGETPRGRRGASDYGGDLLLASQFGVVPLSALVSGLQDEDKLYFTAKINSLYRIAYEERRDLFGLEVKSLPAEGLMMVVWPKVESKEDVQLAYDPITQSWTIFSGIPMLTVEHYRGTTYFGSHDNDVFTLADGPDHVMLDPETDGEAREIAFSLTTAFTDFQMPGQFKRAQFIRPVFIADNVPLYGIEARFDYDISEVTPPPSGPPAAVSIWDLATWDLNRWQSGYQIDQPVYGGFGMGRTVAIGLQGSTNSGNVVLASFDLMVDVGGLL